MRGFTDFYYIREKIVMINEENAKRYCKDDISEIYGYQDAIADKHNVWACHHCLGLIYTKKELIEKGLYYNQPAEMLMFVEKGIHEKLHWITQDERKRKISEMYSGKNSPNYGKRRSKESIEKMKSKKIGKKMYTRTKKKMSDSHINNPKLSKRIGQYTLDGDFVCEYPSLSEAARRIGVSVSIISRVCAGNGKQCKGFIFAYI